MDRSSRWKSRCYTSWLFSYAFANKSTYENSVVETAPESHKGPYGLKNGVSFHFIGDIARPYAKKNTIYPGNRPFGVLKIYEYFIDFN